MGCMKVLTALVFGGLRGSNCTCSSCIWFDHRFGNRHIRSRCCWRTNHNYKPGDSVPSQVSTTDTGYYSVPNLIPGTYSVVAEAKGFKLVRVQNVTVNLNSIVRVDCTLEVGNISETVTVSAETALLKTEKADVSGVIEGRTLNQLPVLNRNVSQMVSLLPGAVRGRSGIYR